MKNKILKIVTIVAIVIVIVLIAITVVNTKNKMNDKQYNYEVDYTTSTYDPIEEYSPVVSDEYTGAVEMYLS